MDYNKLRQIKKKKREIKRTDKRNASAEEVIFVFEKVLEEWRTIKIYNTIIQQNPNSVILKKNVEQIATGNCKVNEHGLDKERYEYYVGLRERVYHFIQQESY